MKLYRADLHIHSVLSPCGDLDMSPDRILKKAQEANLDIIAITDHNSLKMAQIISEAGKEYGIAVIPGVEVTTKEEVHCICLFESIDLALEFQKYIDNKRIKVRNKPDIFGYQVVVGRDETILETEEYLLINALDASIKEIEKEVHKLNGLFIPAHVLRSANGILRSLGFIPENLDCDALEISGGNFSKRDALPNLPIVAFSDAHFLNQIGTTHTIFKMMCPSFEELRLAIHGEGGRSIYQLINEI